MTLPRVGRVAGVGGEAGAGELLAARLAFLGEKVRAQPIDQRAERRLGLTRVHCGLRVADCGLRHPAQPLQIAREHRELRVMAGTVVQERVEPAAGNGERLAQASCRGLARDGRRQIARPFLQKPAQRVRRHQTPIQQRRNAAPQTPLAELREHQRDVVIFSRDTTTDAQRLIERLPDEPGHLGVVRQLESGIDVGFERKLAQQREAEGVDRRDGDVAEPRLQIAPARGVELVSAARFLQAIDNALPQLGGKAARRSADPEDADPARRRSAAS